MDTGLVRVEHTDSPAPSETLLRLPAVKAATGLSRSTIYERIRKGTFPAPVRLGEAAVGWPASRVNEWIQCRITDRMGAYGTEPSTFCRAKVCE